MTTAAEMAELAGPAGAGQGTPGFRGDDETGQGNDDRTSEQIRVLDALSGRSPRPVPDIARRAGMSTAAVLGALGMLDLDGMVDEREQGWVRASRRGSDGGSS